ncbi:MAG: hypothetical protein WBH86_04260 [Thermogutta sp.]|nr:hypothetical protein [Thermogutta sp.]HPU07876.1 hypothetical protein [Thermogutta sp.]
MEKIRLAADPGKAGVLARLELGEGTRVIARGYGGARCPLTLPCLPVS